MSHDSACAPGSWQVMIDEHAQDRYRRFRAVRDHAIQQDGFQPPRWCRPWMMVPTLTAAVSPPVQPRHHDPEPSLSAGPKSQRVPATTRSTTGTKLAAARLGAEPIIPAVPAGPLLCAVRIDCSVGCCVGGASFGNLLEGSTFGEVSPVQRTSRTVDQNPPNEKEGACAFMVWANTGPLGHPFGAGLVSRF